MEGLFSTLGEKFKPHKMNPYCPYNIEKLKEKVMSA